MQITWPKTCPFCGAKEGGGSDTYRIYRCGCKGWVDESDPDDPMIKMRNCQAGHHTERDEGPIVCTVQPDERSMTFIEEKK